MIPREILKKIRQIGIRTNRVVTETLAGFSFQPAAQFGRIPRAMPNCGDYYFSRFGFNCEINRIRPRRRHFCFSGQTARERKSFRIFANFSEGITDFVREFLAKSPFAFVIEINRLGEFPFGFLFNDYPKTHRLARNRFSMSVTTSSSGRQRSGCAKARSARRSSSAICSGVSLSSNLSRSCSKTSRCSSNGSRSSCSKTWAWAALMASIYSVGPLAQAGFFRRAASRSSTLANTCSAGIPECGFLRNSSARRSNSAICSGVNSSSYSVNSSKICWTSSRRSFLGKFLMRSRISSAVMAAIYPVDLPAQAGFSASRITHHASRHP